MKKILLALLLIIVIALAAIIFYAPTIIKDVAETEGSKALGADVKIENVSINPFSGTVSLDGLLVGNPKGFDADHSFELKGFEAEVDTMSLFSDTIHIKRIFVNEPKITYELSSSGSNINALEENVSKTGSKQQEQAKDDQKASKKVIIDDLHIKGILVNPAFRGKGITLPVGDIRLKDIGKDNGGESYTNVLSNILNNLIYTISSSKLGKNVGEVKEEVKEVLQDANDAVNDGIESGSDAINDGINSIFGE